MAKKKVSKKTASNDDGKQKDGHAHVSKKERRKKLSARFPVISRKRK